jgi:DNA-binding transcriptional LysR family regulator
MRTRAGVELSDAGVAMFKALAEPFGAIETVDRELGVQPSRRVVVSTMPSFAATWLVPRLSRFALLYPDIEIVVEATKRLDDSGGSPLIWLFGTAWENTLGSMRPGSLVASELIVVASPSS